MNIVIFDPDIFDYEDDLGYHAFDDMDGTFMRMQEQLEKIIRPGHPGETTRRTAARADESQITTIRACVNEDQAESLLASLQELVDGSGYEFYQHGFSKGFYKILGVQMAQLVPLSAPLGYLESSPTLLAPYIWRILHTIAPPPPGP